MTACKLWSKSSHGFPLQLYIQADEQRCRLGQGPTAIIRGPSLKGPTLKDTSYRGDSVLLCRLAQGLETLRMALPVPVEEMVMLSTVDRGQATQRTFDTPLFFHHWLKGLFIYGMTSRRDERSHSKLAPSLCLRKDSRDLLSVLDRLLWDSVQLSFFQYLLLNTYMRLQENTMNWHAAQSNNSFNAI